MKTTFEDRFHEANGNTDCECDDDMTASGHNPACKWFDVMEALLEVAHDADERLARATELLRATVEQLGPEGYMLPAGVVVTQAVRDFLYGDTE